MIRVAGEMQASTVMSNRIIKTEHAGAKNGGGYWGKRHEAKVLSKRVRRAQSRRLVYSEAAEFRNPEPGNSRVKVSEKREKQS